MAQAESTTPNWGLNCAPALGSHAIDASLPADEAEHGGDLAAIRAAWPLAPQPWLDLSTGINPWPYPVGRVPAWAWQRLPGSAEEQALRRAAAVFYAAPAPDCVVIAPGSQSLIQWLPRLRPIGQVAIVTPTYGEHERSWRQAGHRVRPIASGAAPPPETDVLIVTRPNNPDGSVAPVDWLAGMAERLARRGGWLVLDEAFADAAPPQPLPALPGVIRLRSFGKFFGLAGARLGFAIASPAVAAGLRAALGPWSVPGPALAVATRALRDDAWIARTRRRLARDAAALDAAVLPRGLELVGGTPLFRLYALDDAAARRHALARAGIHVRGFSAQPHWLRFGLPADAAARRRLIAALG